MKILRERGQTATEYMVLISVVVIAVAAAAYVFVPTFGTGVAELSGDVSQILKDNGSIRGGYGLAANNASSGGYDTAGGGSHATTGTVPAGAQGCSGSSACTSDTATDAAASNGGF